MALAPPGESEKEGASALDELAADCYIFIYVDRLRSLQAQLRVKPDIADLVHLNLRHFLLERQRQHDPLGIRLFDRREVRRDSQPECAWPSLTGGRPAWPC